ncbi:hypothetical protein Rhopal_001846-T1 [Rhodotorula paludigena]|uniref:TATA element modulatory factor 1 TATA binding domain-containing protein n=1 Tax=Rhodotorula paludigena TaxID=86838 RepID=A0AAV5GH62_9BASI|nr:hypothetical protein Rhopal_001846-T1 [Rhodotorula paludigena]
MQDDLRLPFAPPPSPRPHAPRSAPPGSELAPPPRQSAETPRGALSRSATPSITIFGANMPAGGAAEVTAHPTTGAGGAVPGSRTDKAKKRARQTGHDKEESSGGGSSSGGTPGLKKAGSVSTGLERLEVKVDKLAVLVSAATLREDIEPLKVSLMALLEELKSLEGGNKTRNSGGSGVGEGETENTEMSSEASKITVDSLTHTFKQSLTVSQFTFEESCSRLLKESLGALSAAKDEICSLKDDATSALKSQVIHLETDISSKSETIKTLESELLAVKTNCEKSLKSLAEKHSRALEDRDREFKEQEVALQEVQEDLAVSKATSTQDLKQLRAFLEKEEESVAQLELKVQVMQMKHEDVLQQLKMDLEEQKQLVEKLDGDVAERSHRILELVKEKKDVEGVVADKIKENSDLRSGRQEVECDLNKAQDDLRAANATIRKGTTELQQERRTVQRQADALARSTADEEALREELTRAREDAWGYWDDLQRQLNVKEQLQKEYNGLSEEKVQLLERVAKLERDLVLVQNTRG